MGEVPSVETVYVLLVPIHTEAVPVILQVGFASVIPLSATEPILVNPLALNVFDAVLAAPYFTQGKDVYLPIATLASVPTTSDAK